MQLQQRRSFFTLQRIRNYFSTKKKNMLNHAPSSFPQIGGASPWFHISLPENDCASFHFSFSLLLVAADSSFPTISIQGWRKEIAESFFPHHICQKNFGTIFDLCEETKGEKFVCAPNSRGKKREKTFSTYRIVCNLYLIFFLLFCSPGEAERFKIRKLLSSFFFMILILCWAKVDIKVGNIWGKFFRTYSALVFGWK